MEIDRLVYFGGKVLSVRQVSRRLQMGLIVRPLHTLDLNLVPSLPRLGKIIIKLHLEPGFRTAAESLGKPDGHFRRNPALAVHNIVERLPRYT